MSQTETVLLEGQNAVLSKYSSNSTSLKNVFYRHLELLLKIFHLYFNIETHD